MRKCEKALGDESRWIFGSSPSVTLMLVTLGPKAFLIQAIRSSACSCVSRSDAAAENKARLQLSHRRLAVLPGGGANLACCPRTSPPCSDPPRCPSPLRSASSCQTPAGEAGSAHQTARSRTGPANKNDS